jgi:hypothetical protein
MGVELLNYGNFEQTNVVVSCVVTNNTTGATVFEYETNVASIAPGETVVTDDDIDIPNDIAQALYTATFTVTSDQIAFDDDPSDNTRLRTFQVTSDKYTLDNIGNHPTGTEQIQVVGSSSFENNSENVKFMTMYVLKEPWIVTGIEVDISTRTDLGSLISVSLLDTTDVWGTPIQVNNPVNGAESDQHTITAQDLTAGVVGIPFLGPVEIPAGVYYATASLSSSNDSAIFILDDVTVPQPNIASVLWIPVDVENNQNLYGGNGTAWAVRLTGNPNISVPEVGELEGVSMYPNPTNGVVRVNGKADERYTLQLTNALGELVHTARFTGNMVLDLSGQAAGVYFARVSDGTLSSVKRIAVN